MRKGYITVFFSLVILMCFSLLLCLIYGVRENASRMKASEAMNVSVRSVFAQYQKDIWEKYNLLMVDSTYGNKTEALILSEEHLKSFLKKNFEEDGIFHEKTSDLLRLSCSDVYTGKVRFVSDNKGQSIRSQAADVMRYRCGVAYVEDLFDRISEIQSESFDSMEEQFEETKSAIGRIDSPDLITWNCAADEAVYSNKDVALLSTLRVVFTDISEISTSILNKNILPENREINRGNYSPKQEENITDILLFKQYLMTYCGMYTKKASDTVLSYEVEYLLSGNESDSENLESIVNRILLLREASNIAALYSDEKRMSVIKAVCSGLSDVILNPELEPALEALTVFIWSYFESISDLRTLLDGKRVPFFKESSDWQTELSFDGGNAVPAEYEDGLSYEDYLRIFLLAADKEKLSMRFLNLVEANVRNKNGTDFTIDSCFDAWEVTAFVYSEYGYYYVLKREYGSDFF